MALTQEPEGHHHCQMEAVYLNTCVVSCVVEVKMTTNTIHKRTASALYTTRLGGFISQLLFRHLRPTIVQ